MKSTGRFPGSRRCRNFPGGNFKRHFQPGDDARIASGNKCVAASLQFSNDGRSEIERNFLVECFQIRALRAEYFIPLLHGSPEFRQFSASFRATANS